MKRGELIAAKVGVVCALALAATAWVARSQSPTERVPPLAIFAGALILAAGSFALYEGASYGLAWLIGRVRRAARSDRDGRGGGPGGTAAALPDDADEVGAESVEDLPSRAAESAGAFGLGGALIAFAAYVAGNAVVWIILGISVALSAAGRAPEGFERAFAEQAPAWMVWSAVCGALAAVAVFRFRSPVPLRDTPGAVGLGPARGVALGVAVGALANVAYLRLVPFLPVQPTRLPESVLWEMLTSEGPARWIVLATAVTVAPVAEELVFRGIVFEGLSRALGSAGGVLGAGALFALLHVPDTAHYWPATVMILTMGLVAGVFRARTGFIGPAVGVHFGHNAVVALIWAV